MSEKLEFYSVKAEMLLLMSPNTTLYMNSISRTKEKEATFFFNELVIECKINLQHTVFDEWEGLF